jgi:hypothetical protein
MANYLLAFHGGSRPESEADQQAVMAAWGQWFESLGPAVVEMGAPVGASSTVGSDGSVSAGGGANPISGYSIIAADSEDDAAAKVQGCPILASGGSIEIAEALAM